MNVRAAEVVVIVLAASVSAAAQPRSADPTRKWEILDNSFLAEEAFNQERGVFQNIFSWSRDRNREWEASFTQEWPAPGIRHQLSYTLVFSGSETSSGFGDAMVNYRFQLRDEDARGPAISPRLSVILPTGRADEGRGNDVVGLQFNVPASKQFGNFYLHANAGMTWLPDVQRTAHLAGSGIWRVAPMLNLMLEGVLEVEESVTISPGFRRGWNFGEHQLVIGAAIPITRIDGRSSAALLTYFSYELPFR